MTEKEYAELIEKNPHLAKQQMEIKRNNKYRNQKVWIYDGVPSDRKLPDKKTKMVFDSKKEYKRYLELKLLEQAGEITELKRQVSLEIIPDFNYGSELIKGIYYKADFMYQTKEGRQTVVEDVKGYDSKTGKFITTKEFIIKWKLLKHKFPEYKFVLV